MQASARAAEARAVIALSFTTQRLRLEPVTTADEPAIIAFHRDPRVTGLLLDTAPATPVLARLFVMWSQDLNARGLGVFAARRRDDEAIVGLFTLTPFEGTEAIELGGKLSPRAWGGDLAAEAGAALIDHAFDSLGHDRLVSAFHPDNRAVPAVLARLGFADAGETVLCGRPAGLMHLSAQAWRGQGGRPLPRRLIGSTRPASRNE
jgi:RimJ/RimL family protein N-acetyltransferase